MCIEYIPHTAIIEITLACNLKCIHCGSSAGKKHENELNLDEILHLCYELKCLDCKGITLMGGEVLLHKDWDKIAQYIIECNMNCAIITNGYLINEKIIEKIKNLGVVQIGISLDGATPETQQKIRGVKDSFEKAIQSIKLSCQYDISLVSIITTVSKINIKGLEPIFQLLLSFNSYIDWQIKLASNHNCDRFGDSMVVDQSDYLQVAEFITKTRAEIINKDLKIRLSEAHDLGYFSEKFPELSQNWQGCLAGIHTIGIQSNGNVKGCLALPDDFIEGNIRERNLAEIWKDPEKFKHSRHFNSSLLEGECQQCDKNHLCKGGCHDFNFSTTGSIYNTPFCLYQMERKFS